MTNFTSGAQWAQAAVHHLYHFFHHNYDIKVTTTDFIKPTLSTLLSEVRSKI